MFMSLFVTGSLALGLLVAQLPQGDDWKLETLHRVAGVPLKGYLVEATPSQVVFKCIYRKPGAPTLLFTETFAPGEVVRVEKLPEAERNLLAMRLESLGRERERLATSLRLLDPNSPQPKMQQEILKLDMGRWPDASTNGNALLYQSQYFKLVTNARQELAQLAAIQLEQVYSAYARTLPSKRQVANPTTILLTKSLEDYQKILQSRSIRLGNPAYFDQAANLVLCGSDLDQISAQIEDIRKHHQEELNGLQKREQELKQLYKNKVPADFLASIQDSRRKIRLANETNLERLKKSRLLLFERLYHEAFHAYLSTCVIDEHEEEFPRWLNEGLAQIFETAVFEIGELRVGHADKQRLEAIRQAITQDTLPSVRDLLLAKADLFLVSHESTREVSQKMYLASWGLAFHLAFRSKALSGPQLHEYTRAIKSKADPVAAFEKLTGKPLDAFQKDHVLYLKSLRVDGTSPLR